MQHRGSTGVNLGFVLLAGSLCLAYVLTDGVPRRATVVLSSALAAGVLTVGLLRRRVVRPGPWWFVVAALVALTAHNLQSLVQMGIEGKPAATGLGPLLTLPLGYLGLLVASVLIAFPYARRDVGGIIDAVIIALGAASLIWAFLLHPALTAQDAATGERLYRLMIILLISGIAGAVVRATATTRRAKPALVYLLLAVTLTLAGNAAGVVTEDPVTGAGAWWIGLLWILAYLALGASAAHPAHAHLADPPVHSRSGRLTTRRLVFLGVVLALNPLLAGGTEAWGHPVDWVLLTTASVALVPLVILRIGQLARLHAEAEHKLAHLATHDQLTGLPNRRGLDEHLELALGRVRAGTSAGLVVLFCDLDGFKAVNDEHGHHVGDGLLAIASSRLRGALRARDLVARFGGDEFVVVVEGDPDLTEGEARDRIRRALADPIHTHGILSSVRASVGSASVRRGEDVSASQLLSTADGHMYAAKRALRTSTPGPTPG
ncbi:GGDEF domain-containing protein [Actinotalea sp. BY-33]|uniref:GGDEF domain-containing protein n=1 Tax=Actinotalea soli TaxID=2819234 RepID=A0A939LQ17_9CELL|nr:GGDEF domain-containing protein [Actinotalea soli]MBO1752266.1 GGDEF domain-containing protein [Actinotalea soli]